MNKMKAFIATSAGTNREKDFLVLAKSKRDALIEFKTIASGTYSKYKIKDFKEVKIYSFTILGMHIGSTPVSSNPSRILCLEFDYEISIEAVMTPEKRYLAETEETYKLMANTFKSENEAIFSGLF